MPAAVKTIKSEKTKKKEKISFRTAIQHSFVKGEYFDYGLFFIVIFLVCFGLVMIYSTSSYLGTQRYGDAAYWLKRQGLFAIAGIFVLLFFSKIDYHIYKRMTILIYFVTIFLLVIVLVIGKEVNGSRRWIDLGLLGFQPSELAKISMILIMAHVVSIAGRKMEKTSEMIKAIVLVVPIVGLIAIQNLSTAIIAFAIALIVVFVSSSKIKQFIGLGVGAVALVAGFLVIEPYRLQRLDVWFHPENYDTGYQTIQALYAVGSGGIFGKGLGSSMQKLGFLPESHNDMIFSILCEELGIFGAICVILLFILLLWRCMIIATNAPDLYGSLIVIGGMTHIGVQVIINISVVTNSIPPTGVPLPFISYGGTSLMFLLIEIGIILSVSRQIKFKQP